jgi:hypothetical protein
MALWNCSSKAGVVFCVIIHSSLKALGLLTVEPNCFQVGSLKNIRHVDLTHVMMERGLTI